MQLLTQNLSEIQKQAGLPDVGVSPTEIIKTSLPYIFGVAGIVLILNIITAGFKMMTSQGDPKTLQGAQSKLSTSAIGILILFTSYWIVKLVMQFLGVTFERTLF